MRPELAALIHHLIKGGAVRPVAGQEALEGRGWSFGGEQESILIAALKPMWRTIYTAHGLQKGCGLNFLDEGSSDLPPCAF
jgi:hypothetical protein